MSMWPILVGYLFWWLTYVMKELMMLMKSLRFGASLGTRWESSWTPKHTRPKKWSLCGSDGTIDLSPIIFTYIPLYVRISFGNLRRDGRDRRASRYKAGSLQLRYYLSILITKYTSLFVCLNSWTLTDLSKSQTTAFKDFPTPSYFPLKYHSVLKKPCRLYS